MSLVNPLGRPDVFKPRELMRASGITTEIYNQWLYRGIFRATKEADGPGSSSQYSFGDIVCVAVILKLRQVDMRLKLAKMLAADIVGELIDWQKKNGGSTNWPTVYLAFCDPGFQIDIDVDNDHETVLRIDLKPLIREICSRIENMGAPKRGRPNKKTR